MKFFIALALVAAVAADVSHLTVNQEYLPPVQGGLPSQEYLPPVQYQQTHFVQQPQFVPQQPQVFQHEQVHYQQPQFVPQQPQFVPQQQHFEPQPQYHVPQQQVFQRFGHVEEPAPAHSFGADGYKYKNPLA